MATLRRRFQSGLFRRVTVFAQTRNPIRRRCSEGLKASLRSSGRTAICVRPLSKTKPPILCFRRTRGRGLIRFCALMRDHYHSVQLPRLRWGMAISSTTGVYGDSVGTGSTKTRRLTHPPRRWNRCVLARTGMGSRLQGLPLHISGDGRASKRSRARVRSKKVRNGTARRSSSRVRYSAGIHVMTSRRVLEGVDNRPDPGAIYNLMLTMIQHRQQDVDRLCCRSSGYRSQRSCPLKRPS